MCVCLFLCWCQHFQACQLSSSYTPAEQLEKGKEVFDTQFHTMCLCVSECVFHVYVLAHGEILTPARQTPNGWHTLTLTLTHLGRVFSQQQQASSSVPLGSASEESHDFLLWDKKEAEQQPHSALLFFWPGFGHASHSVSQTDVIAPLLLLPHHYLHSWEDQRVLHIPTLGANVMFHDLKRHFLYVLACLFPIIMLYCMCASLFVCKRELPIFCLHRPLCIEHVSVKVINHCQRMMTYSLCLLSALSA